jgi:hypothetical protein
MTAALTCTGRSLRDCQLAFDNLLQQRSQPQSFPPLAPQFSSSFPPAIPPHRLYAEQPHLQPQPAPRPIQPRPSRSTDSPNPASTNGEAPLTIVRTIGPELSGERRKKRGRPTKEEVEERTALLAAEGKVYAPKKRPKFRASTGTPIPMSERTPTSPSMQTPLAQTVEVKEDSSSGKRRSKRRSSLIGLQTQPEPNTPTTRTGDEKAAESPSDRLLARGYPHERVLDRPMGVPPGPGEPPTTQ